MAALSLLSLVSIPERVSELLLDLGIPQIVDSPDVSIPERVSELLLDRRDCFKRERNTGFNP